MRYFKRINKEYSGYKAGVIYPENAVPSRSGFYDLKKSLKEFPNRWKEVSEIDYIKQEGWYIKGSKEFEKWLKAHGSKVNNTFRYYGDTEFMCYFMKNGELSSSNVSKLKDHIEVTIDQLNKIYNIKPKKKEIEFKVGDKVLVTSWYYADIRLPQEGVIREINLKSNTPYFIELKEAPFNSAKTWYFKKGEFEHLNKQKEMENFQVNVNEVTSEILQNLAFENGWSWNMTNNRNISNLKCSYLNFYVNNRTITHGSSSRNKKVSLEEAIKRITTKKESFEVGDWVVVVKAEKGAYAADGLIGRIIPGDTETSNGTCDKEGYAIEVPKGNTWTIGKNPDLRKATKQEIEKALIEEAERRGFKDGMKGVDVTRDNLPHNTIHFSILEYDSHHDWLCDGWGNVLYCEGKWAKVPDEPKEIFGFEVQKSKDGLYKFGCRDHVYTKSEITRVLRTLNNLPPETTIDELMIKLSDIVRS